MRYLINLCSLMIFLFISLQGFAAENATYKKILKKEHKKGEIFNYENFHDVLYWDVVYKNAELREASARKFAHDFRLSDDDLKAKLLDEEQDAALGPEFVVVLYTYERKWNDIDSKTSVWKIQLESGSQVYEPSDITKIKPTMINLALYPYSAPWTEMYSVRFPKEALSLVQNDFSLSIYGIRGHSTLRWKINP